MIKMRLTVIAIILVAIITACRHYESLKMVEEKPDNTPEPDKEELLKLELIKAPQFINIDWDEDIIIKSNKKTTIIYELKEGKGELIHGTDTIKINKQHIELLAGENVLKFKAYEENKKLKIIFTSIELDEFEEPTVIDLKIFTYGTKPDFDVELSYDTPDNEFLQYKPVKLDIKIKPKSNAETNGTYTYEYEIINGDALVRSGNAAPRGTKIEPKQRLNMKVNDTKTLWVTPLVPEQTWVRVIVRKDFGNNKNYTGAYLRMDYVDPRRKPNLYTNAFNVSDSTGRENDCGNPRDPHACRSPRFWYIYYRYLTDGAGCHFSGTEVNERVKFRVDFRQLSYYVPNQKYKVEVAIRSGSNYFTGQVAYNLYRTGESHMVDYDYIIDQTSVNVSYFYMDVIIPKSRIPTGDPSKNNHIMHKENIELYLIIKDSNNKEVERSSFPLTFVLMAHCQDV